MSQVEPVDISAELFVDNLIIGSSDGTQLKMHEPQRLRRTPPRPFGHYATVLKDGENLRLYYRGDKVPGAALAEWLCGYHEGGHLYAGIFRRRNQLGRARPRHP